VHAHAGADMPLTARAGPIVSPIDVRAATDNRDSLAKTLYQRLFDWLVATVNTSIGQDASAPTLVGVLDIYGARPLRTAQGGRVGLGRAGARARAQEQAGAAGQQQCDRPNSAHARDSLGLRRAGCRGAADGLTRRLRRGAFIVQSPSRAPAARRLRVLQGERLRAVLHQPGEREAAAALQPARVQDGAGALPRRARRARPRLSHSPAAGIARRACARAARAGVQGRERR